MSRSRVSAAGMVVVAFVLLATACTNDFDTLFPSESSSGSSSGGIDAGKDKDVSTSGCVKSCETEIKNDDSGKTTYGCTSCACSCPKILCGTTATECTGFCEGNTSCEAFCSSAKTCSLECESGASCILHCAKGFTCDLQCSGGKTETCGDGVFACNAKCP